jgi:hypothetical protein
MALSPELLALVKKGKAAYTKSSRSVKLKEGKTTLRVVGKPNEKFWADLGVHWIKTEKNGKPVAVCGCDDIVHQKPCLIDTAIDRASKAASDDETLAIIKEWKVKKSVLVNALVRSGSDASEEPQVVELTPTTFGQILSTIEEYANSDIDILSFGPDGMDFIVERIGKGLDTEYRVMTAPKSKPVPAGTLERLHDLDAYIEKEFFRGDERKALVAIANMTGVSVGGPALSGPSGTALLTGPSGVVDDAEVEAEVVEELDATAPWTEAPPTAPAAAASAPAPAPAAAAAPAAVAPKPAPAPAAAAPAAKPAAPKPAAAPAAAPVAAPAADFNAALPQDEVDEMLKELDGISAS